jgi:hypothetical protein
MIMIVVNKSKQAFATRYQNMEQALPSFELTFDPREFLNGNLCSNATEGQ